MPPHATPTHSRHAHSRHTSSVLHSRHRYPYPHLTLLRFPSIPNIQFFASEASPDRWPLPILLDLPDPRKDLKTNRINLPLPAPQTTSHKNSHCAWPRPADLGSQPGPDLSCLFCTLPERPGHTNPSLSNLPCQSYCTHPPRVWLQCLLDGRPSPPT